MYNLWPSQDNTDNESNASENYGTSAACEYQFRGRTLQQWKARVRALGQFWVHQ